MAEELERIYTIPLRDVFEKPMNTRAVKAIKIIKVFLARHMKPAQGIIRISEDLNMAIWSHGMKKPPRKIKVIARRDKEGVVTASVLAEKPAEKKGRVEKEKKVKEPTPAKKEEAKKEAKPEKKPEAKKEAKPEKKAEKGKTQ